MSNLILKRNQEFIFQGLLFGILAAIANLLLSIPIYASLNLSWGMGLCIYVLISFGIRAAIIPLIFSIGSMYLLNESLIHMGISFAEFITIAYLIQKRVFVVMASLCFWLFIGSPICWLYLNNFSASGNSQDFSLVFATMQGLNGLFNASLAAMLYLLTPTKWISEHISSAKKSLSSNIFALSALTLILPLVTVSLVLAGSASVRNEEQLIKILKAQATSVSLATDRFIGEHYSVVKQLAKTLSIVSDEELRKNILIDAQSDHPNFFNLTIIDAEGYTTFFAPERYNDELRDLPKNLRYVTDRRYFIHAREIKTPFISNAMMSRGIISAPMIAISSPIITNKKFQGALLGAINLQFIADLHEKMEATLQTDYTIITDKEDRVIYASSPVGLKSLEPFYVNVGKSEFTPNLPVLSINGKNHPYHIAKNSYGWKVYIIKQPTELVKLFSQHIMVLAATVIAIILLFLFIAYKLAIKITSPLVKLLENSSENYISNFEATRGATSSQEINDVAAKLRKSHNLLRDFEDQLQQQVSEKTTQLEQMNLQLAAQAREDGLTQLLNRSGFDEIAYNAIKTNQRLNQPISLFSAKGPVNGLRTCLHPRPGGLPRGSARLARRTRPGCRGLP